MKYACFFAAVVFSLFTYWQFNDYEQYGTKLWYGWVIIYGVTALLSMGAIFRPLSRLSYMVLGLLAITGALIRAAFINWDKPIFYNEANPAGNEAGGLLVVGLWLMCLAYAGIIKSAKSSTP